MSIFGYPQLAKPLNFFCCRQVLSQQKLYDYVQYNLKEIAFSSSLLDPPHIKKRRKLTWHERFLVLKEASRLYAASWVRDIGPDLRPNDYNKDDGTEGKSNGDKSRSTET
ncbi:hypothetical protein J1N35_027835 [Gossypium stocksii]|uniref:Uncharacterized protein n=1 Tax=Gossypium stocksii TaxID=47602 RepID=A0A9D3VAL5_9ROSI|nr:hypothetical protein J1N35_027835 [Gossypium stocksii]